MDEITRGRTKRNKLAILAFMCGIIGLWVHLMDVFALILGIIAISQLKKTGEKGKNLAILAIILSLFLPLILLSSYIVWLRARY